MVILRFLRIVKLARTLRALRSLDAWRFSTKCEPPRPRAVTCQGTMRLFQGLRVLVAAVSSFLPSLLLGAVQSNCHYGDPEHMNNHEHPWSMSICVCKSTGNAQETGSDLDDDAHLKQLATDRHLVVHNGQNHLHYIAVLALYNCAGASMTSH